METTIMGDNMGFRVQGLGFMGKVFLFFFLGPFSLAGMLSQQGQ